NTRHELTRRPSKRTLQAPQLPLLQPSLVPVSRNSSRKTSSRLCRGSHRKSVSLPLMVAWIWIRLFTCDSLAKTQSKSQHPHASTPALHRNNSRRVDQPEGLPFDGLEFEKLLAKHVLDADQSHDSYVFQSGLRIKEDLHASRESILQCYELFF